MNTAIVSHKRMDVYRREGLLDELLDVQNRAMGRIDAFDDAQSNEEERIEAHRGRRVFRLPTKEKEKFSDGFYAAMVGKPSALNPLTAGDSFFDTAGKHLSVKISE